MQLIVITGPDNGQTFPLENGQTLLVGRGQESDTHLRDPRISRKQCQVAVEAGTVRLLHLSSGSPTLVNGQAATDVELKPGDVVRIGETELRFQLDAAGDNETTLYAASPTPTPQPVPAASRRDLSELYGQAIHRYQIKQELAQGTTGVVFLAGDTVNDRLVALKVLWPEFSQNEEEMNRFVRAMKSMHPIKHENIVHIYNAGKQGQYCWVAMEYVEGESLTKIIERFGTAGMLDWQTAFRVAVHIARALEAAYEHQIIHRNITPENILLRSSDKVAKLGDLMLAKALEGTLAEQITRPGQLVGDVCYMSPERTRGADDVDCRSDIYSLGATIYALLTGRPPFESKSLPELISKIRSEEPAKPKQFQLSIADMFQDAVLQMLAKRPEDRYQTPTALLRDLERIGTFQGIEA